MQRIYTVETANKEGAEVLIKGWVHARRNMGKIAFLDLRDRFGLVQVVGVPSELDEVSNEDLKRARLEYLLEIRGIVQKRGEKQVNRELPTGSIEVLAKEIKIISASEPMPFEVDSDTKKINEELRLKYRYLDLRSDRMKNNLKMRHEMNLFFRNYFSENGFWEIETPCLTKGTPEGSREYLVPSRIYPGNFYVLPQSPQQFKQLLMVGGVEKYFQIARCFRDEDQRGDRQPEFTQFDLEMSFVKEEDVMAVTEAALVALVEKLYPEKKIQSKPFPRISYAECMEKYGNDKPDLRKNKDDKDELAFCWIVDFPMFEKGENGSLGASHHPFTRPKSEDVELLESNPEKAKACAYDIVLNGFEIGGGSLRIYDPLLQRRIFEILGLREQEINDRFGHMIEAFTYGVPPHGGLALGLDRIIMLLQNEDNIREVIAFPKTGDARDPMMGSPSQMPKETLDEVHIKVK